MIHIFASVKVSREPDAYIFCSTKKQELNGQEETKNK